MRRDQRERRLVAILFTDLVGTSALAQRNENAALRALQQHRRYVRALLPAFRGREMEISGHSFLIEFQSSWDAMRCAIALQRRHAAHNRHAAADDQLELRIGIHLGDVEHRANEVIGDGVNLAARVEPLAPVGGIAVTAYIHGHVQNKLKVPMRSLGPQQLKNIATPTEVFVLDPAAIETADIEEPTPQIDAPLSLRRRRSVIVAAAGAAALVAMAVAVGLASRDRPASMASVAVLPFDNLGDAQSQGFTDGLQDSLITHLAKIDGIKIIARYSTLHLASERHDLASVARELGVRTLVEGSVQREGDRIRINAQLIRAADGAHLWAGDYDRRIVDLFALQADMAEQIARRIGSLLTESQRDTLHRGDHGGLAGYETYLRAREVTQLQNGLTLAQQDGLIDELEATLAQQPDFAAGFAMLSILHGYKYELGVDTSATRRHAIEQAARRAVQLDPDLAEAHRALAGALGLGAHDYTGANHELTLAEQLAPGDAEIHRLKGLVLERIGSWKPALEEFRHARELDPRNPRTLFSEAWALVNVRRYAQAAADFDALDSITTEPGFTAVSRAYLTAYSEGQTTALHEAVGRLPAAPSPTCQNVRARYNLDLWERRFAVAAQDFRDCPLARIAIIGNQSLPTSVLSAMAFELAGDTADAHTAYAQARPLLEADLQEHPEWGRSHVYLAHALAGLGEREAALAQAQAGLDATPVTSEAEVGAIVLRDAASFYAKVGERRRALDLLQRSLSLPGETSANFLRLDADWDGLRDDPEFRRIVREHSPPGAAV